MEKRKGFTLIELLIVTTAASILLMLLASMYPKFLDFIRTKREVSYLEDNMEAVQNLITTKPFSPAALKEFLYHEKDIYGMPFYYKAPSGLSDNLICVVHNSDLYVCEISNYSAFKNAMLSYNGTFSCSSVGGNLVQAGFVMLSSGKDRNIQTPILKLSPSECSSGTCYVVPVFRSLIPPEENVDWYPRVNGSYTVSSSGEKWLSSATGSPVNDRFNAAPYDDVVRYLPFEVAKERCPLKNVEGSIDRFWAQPNSIPVGGTTTLYWIASLYGSSLNLDEVRCVLDYGDGNSEELNWSDCVGYHHRSHAYSTAGIKVPVLKVFDDTGHLILMKTTTLNVRSSSPSCSVSQFTATVISQNGTASTYTAPATLTASAPASVDFSWNINFNPSCSDKSCFVDFGDGVTSGRIADCSSLTSVSHTYSSAGTFTAVLRTSCGCESDAFTISIASSGGSGTGGGGTPVTNYPPTVNSFTVSPLYGTPPQTVNISYSVSDADGNLNSVIVTIDGVSVPACSWSGSGASASKSCSASIETPGIHTVYVIATDQRGAQSQRFVLVNLLQGFGGIGIEESGGGGTTYVIPWVPPSGTIVVARIRNPNNETLQDFQVKIDALPVRDCIGLKFKVTTTAGEEVPYCFERENGECGATFCDSSDPDCSDPYDENFWTGNIWIKVPSIPANGETTLIFQPDTSYHAVSGSEVFDFYDDFNGNGLSDAWSVSPWIGYQLSNGTIVMYDSANNGDLAGISASTGFGAAGLVNRVYETRAKAMGNLWPINLRLGNQNPQGYTDGTYAQLKRYTGYGSYPYSLIIRHNGSVVAESPISADFNGKWVTLSYVVLQDSQLAKAKIEDLGEFEASSSGYSSYANDNLGLFINTSGGQSAKAAFDWVRVRKYAPEAPTATLSCYAGNWVPSVTPTGCSVRLTVTNLGDCDLANYQFRIDISSPSVKSCLSSSENPGEPSFIVCYGDACGDDSVELDFNGNVVGIPYCFETQDGRCENATSDWSSQRYIWVKIPLVPAHDFVYLTLQRVPESFPKNAVGGAGVFDYYKEP